jgi:hypothetical protein
VVDVYEAIAAHAGPPPDTQALVTALRARGLKRLLADPAISARVARVAPDIATRPANGVLDSHGTAWPPASLMALVRVWPSDGLLVPAEDADALRRRLGAQGLDYTAEPLAGQVLFHGLATFPPVACRRTAWRQSTREPGAGGPAVIEARLQEPQQVVGVRVTHPAVSIEEVPVPEVAVSDDGRAWRPVTVRRVSEWAWAGRVLIPSFGRAEALWLSPTPARFVRIELRLPAGPEPAITSVCVSGWPR